MISLTLKTHFNPPAVFKFSCQLPVVRCVIPVLKPLRCSLFESALSQSTEWRPLKNVKRIEAKRWPAQHSLDLSIDAK